MENELESKRDETSDKNLNISDVRNSVELMLENEKNIMNGLAVDKLLIYHNDTHSFSRCDQIFTSHVNIFFS